LDQEAIYALLPIWLQNKLVSREGARVKKLRFTQDYLRLLNDYQERSGWSQDRISEFRDHRLSTFIDHAVTTVPYYREHLASKNINGHDISNLQQLRDLPILSRATVQEQTERFLSSKPGGATLSCHTSGSTGAGLVFPSTLQAHREQWAVWWRFRGWHGLSLETPCLYLGGRSVVPLKQQEPPYWRTDKPGTRMLFSGYHLGPQTAGDYLNEMRRLGYTWMHGYPSMISLLAGYALDLGIQLPVTCISLGAENVMPSQEGLIERAFGVRPIQHYGMAEGVGNISMCPKRRLHVDEDFAALEFLPNEDGSFRIVGTGFSNWAFPLIRYEVGDLAAPSDQRCDCGRPGRIVQHVDGREEDLVVTRSGAKLGRLDHIFKDMINVKEAQIRQTRKGHMDVWVVRGPAYGQADEDKLRSEIAKRVGNEVAFAIGYKGAIPKTKNGKLRFVVSGL
jgi:phenylacetate-CoA ligase